MSEIKEVKKNTDKRTELPVSSADLPKEEVTQKSVFSEVINMFSKFTSKIRTTKNIELSGDAKITFEGQTTQYDIYRPAGDNSELRIDARTDAGNERIIIGGLNKPLEASMIGTDESNVIANNNTNNTTFQVLPTRADFSTNGTNLFRLGFPNLASTPSTCAVGDITVAGAKLYICTATNTWTIVGTQT